MQVLFYFFGRDFFILVLILIPCCLAELLLFICDGNVFRSVELLKLRNFVDTLTLF